MVFEGGDMIGNLRSVGVCALLGSLLLTACSSTPATPPELGDAWLAIGASYQSSDLAQGGRGKLILVDHSGETRVVGTAGMDMMELAWTGSELAYSDVDADYLLGAKLIKIPRATEQSLQAGIWVESGGVKTVFNTGRGNSGYEATLTGFDSEHSHSELIKGLAPLGVAHCAEGSYVFGDAVDSRDFPNAVRFQAADETSSGTATFVFPFEVSIGAPELACSGRVAFAVVEDPRADSVDDQTPRPVYLARMNLASGDLKLIRMKTSDGALSLPSSEVDYSTAVPNVRADGAVDWVSGRTGTVYRTDTGSGSTEIIKTGLPGDIYEDSIYSFRGSELTVLSGIFSNELRVDFYDIENSWSHESSHDLPKVGELVGSMVVRSVLTVPNAASTG